MTEKEKAKAYDEALKKASAAHKDEDKHLKATLERIFPELKESEDERIKKAIIEFFESEDDNTTYSLVRKKDIIDWIKSKVNIDKNKIMAEIEKRKRINALTNECAFEEDNFPDTIESIDPYEQRVQYDSIKAGIRAHAETYSFNIESELFNQLTKEQQALWRKEIEQACISGGEAGVELARDQRYKENLE